MLCSRRADLDSQNCGPADARSSPWTAVAAVPVVAAAPVALAALAALAAAFEAAAAAAMAVGETVTTAQEPLADVRPAAMGALLRATAVFRPVLRVATQWDHRLLAWSGASSRGARQSPARWHLVAHSSHDCGAANSFQSRSAIAQIVLTTAQPP